MFCKSYSVWKRDRTPVVLTPTDTLVMHGPQTWNQALAEDTARLNALYPSCNSCNDDDDDGGYGHQSDESKGETSYGFLGWRA
jgi:hypothetical protein